MFINQARRYTNIVACFVLALATSFVFPSVPAAAGAGAGNPILKQESQGVVTMPLGGAGKIKNKPNPLSIAFNQQFPQGITPAYLAQAKKIAQRLTQKGIKPVRISSLQSYTSPPDHAIKPVNEGLLHETLSPDLALLARSYPDNTFAIYDSQMKKRKLILSTDGYVHRCNWSPNSRFIQADSLYKNRIWNVQTGKIVWQQCCDLNNYRCYRQTMWSPDGCLVLLSAIAYYGAANVKVDSVVDCFIVDMKTGIKKNIFSDSHIKKIKQYQSNQTLEAIWSPDSRSLLIVCDLIETPESYPEPIVYSIDVQTGTINKSFSIKNRYDAIAWSPDSRLIAMSGTFRYCTCNRVNHLGHNRGYVEIHENKREKLQRKDCCVFPSDAKTPNVIWSPNSHFLAVIPDSSYRTWFLIDARTQAIVYTFTYDHDWTTYIRKIVWSHDSCLVHIKEREADSFNVACFTDRSCQEEIEAYKKGVLNSAQYMLLQLLDDHSDKARQQSEQCDQQDKKQEEEKTVTVSVLSKIITLSGLQGVNEQDLAHAFMMFSHTVQTLILNTYAIDENEVAFERYFNSPNSHHLAQFGANVLAIIREYRYGCLPEKALVLTSEQHIEQQADQTLKADLDAAQKWKTEKEASAAQLFQAIRLCNLALVKKYLNPVTVLSRNPENNNFRTPLMEIIWQSQKQYSNYAAIFNELLTFKKEYVFDSYNKEYRTSDLTAQDFQGNTALMLAIQCDHFDYALQIAQTMNADASLHRAFKIINSDRKTAYDLAKQKKAVGHDSHFVPLISILDMHKKPCNPEVIKKQPVTKKQKKACVIQ